MTYAYVGRAECGCIRAITVDRGDKYTGKTVAEFIEDGLTVERMAVDPVDGIRIDHCLHGEMVRKSEEAV
jgi:hypothetical protein